MTGDRHRAALRGPGAGIPRRAAAGTRSGRCPRLHPRGCTPLLEDDRPQTPDIEALSEMVRDGSLIAGWKKHWGRWSRHTGDRGRSVEESARTLGRSRSDHQGRRGGAHLRGGRSRRARALADPGTDPRTGPWQPAMGAIVWVGSGARADGRSPPGAGRADGRRRRTGGHARPGGVPLPSGLGRRPGGRVPDAGGRRDLSGGRRGRAAAS